MFDTSWNSYAAGISRVAALDRERGSRSCAGGRSANSRPRLRSYDAIVDGDTGRAALVESAAREGFEEWIWIDLKERDFRLRTYYKGQWLLDRRERKAKWESACG